MSLLDQIKTDLTQARKAKDSFLLSVLSTLYAEAAIVGKNDGNRETTDAEAVAKIKAFIKNIDETLKSIDETHRKFAELRKEKTVLEKYLPQQLSEDQLKVILTEIAGEHEKSMKSMGKIMTALKEKHGGEYDGKLASQVVKNILSG